MDPDILVALNPGEQVLLVDRITLTLGKTAAPGTYTVRWGAGGYLSNEVRAEVK